jgi:uncharacterized cupin superfamily protein
MTEKRKFLLKAKDILDMPEVEGRHSMNPKAELHGRSLSEAVGLERLGVHVIRVPGGKEANEYHAHRFEEEFFYVLAGRGIVTIDGEEHEIGPGDFMGFPTPSVAHGLYNPHREDLVYIVGGERREFEIGELVRHDTLVIKERDVWHVVKRESIFTRPARGRGAKDD